MSEAIYDIAILGAGPAGCSAAISLSGKGYRVLLLDKATFPRDKICGDALSPDVVNQFKKIDEGLYNRLIELKRKEEITGVKVTGSYKDAPTSELVINAHSKGYVVSRMDFDNMLAEEVKSRNDIDFKEGFKAKEVSRLESAMELVGEGETYRAKLLIAADGINSQVAKKFMNYELDRRYHCGALRVYYEGVEFEDHNKIELHFIEDVLPGYFWIFPMSDNRANVGIGMLSSYISKKKVNLKEVLTNVIANHPEFAPRFKNAKPLESIKGMGIPIGSRKYQLSDDRILLTGDAACLVDPLTGEGIANAIRSGRFAAEYAAKAVETQNFSASALKAYDKKIYKMLSSELKMGAFLQWLVKDPKRLNFIVRKVSQSQRFKRWTRMLFEDNHFFGDWSKPSFYWRLIRGKKKYAASSK